MMEKFMTDSWDALRFDRAEWSGGHAVMAADPKPFRSNPPERHTLQRKLLSTSFFFPAHRPSRLDNSPDKYSPHSGGLLMLQCLIVFYDQQEPHLLKISDHYSSRHDLVLVFH